MKGNPLYILLWLFLILCFACSPGKKEKKYVIGVSPMLDDGYLASIHDT